METSMDVFDCIITRRSVRNYTDEQIADWIIQKILETAIWAPSGKNGQPWKFKIISEKDSIDCIAQLLPYNRWIKKSNCIIAIFLDKNSSYDYIKDVLSCGAFIQNILLAANGLGVGSCWVGINATYESEIQKLIQVDMCNLELVGMVTLGYKSFCIMHAERKGLESFLL